MTLMPRGRKTAMQFESRVFQLAKDTDKPEQCEDAFRVDDEGGVAVIADGATSAIFSKQWAAILAQAALADAPDPDDKEAFGRWLKGLRETWAQEIDTSALQWFQKPRLRVGAFSTLLWVRLLENDAEEPGESSTCGLHGRAIGDSCLFHVRDGQILRTFPIQSADQMKASPMLLGSVDLNRDHLLVFGELDQRCRRGDLLVLCTDAVAVWALRTREAGTPPAWEDYWDMPEEAWREEIISLRGRSEMPVDDATLVLLRVTDQVVAPRQTDHGEAATETYHVTQLVVEPPNSSD